MTQPVRVRFAPSPTGGLHLGGVRTVLYNYLFAKQHNGTFVLRIEDTDQSRFVAGAEDYIIKCLEWCGLQPDESPEKGGPFAPYRQSERKAIYGEYAKKLLESGHAYYAFDTPAELEAMRQEHKTEINPSPQYDHRVRTAMRNSLTMQPNEVVALLESGIPYVVRIKMPEHGTASFADMIRGEVEFNTALSDDKVLLKADGMPTYHLAVVVDDYLMGITHAFRGEEWLPSAPVHVMLWEYLGWKDRMPQWVHLPLILKPEGNGKLSKRDADRLGFPIFAMDWTDPKSGEETKGFKERGFLPEAFVNMLAMLGWNDGSGQEIFSMEELIERFSIERVHKGGAKFDFEKAKWFNHQYLQRMDGVELATLIAPFIAAHGGTTDADHLAKVAMLIKDRCSLLEDFWEQGDFFFQAPQLKELPAIKDKWNEQKQQFFTDWMPALGALTDWQATAIEESFNTAVAAAGIKKGEVMLPFRIMLVGGKYGPGVFDIAALIGQAATLERIKAAMAQL